MSAEGFTKTSNGGSYGYGWRNPKWRCDTCGRAGYGSDTEVPYSWAEACRVGHSPCVWCGRQLTLRKDGSPRVHSRCPERPDEAELLRLVITEARQDARLGVRGPLDRKAADLLARLTTHLGATS